MQSLKNYSRLTNILVFVAGFISYIGADGLKGIIPDEYQYVIPFVVMLAGYILVQVSEENRVQRAETIAVNDTLNAVNSPNQEGLNAEYRKL